ncbi:uncharacterized protein ColSpa_11189 [Colletotrichum spaethianum]|uniref:Uncharacterized protein n=1 Tax=Colletotrichum spaethianum TaxID=700344 RepID=A0AA37PEV0_9PEZI|nr:uncharacterized protein ColSpa_11189 [Colletotrichum spaethianum]GKT51008.1 hypothetical protein ColSpa_11189 [Colletotrichum spaethianum]
MSKWLVGAAPALGPPPGMYTLPPTPNPGALCLGTAIGPKFLQLFAARSYTSVSLNVPLSTSMFPSPPTIEDEDIGTAWLKFIGPLLTDSSRSESAVLQAYTTSSHLQRL